MILDAHTHMPSEDWPGHPTPFPTVERAVAYLKGSGTDAALFNTWQSVYPESAKDLDEANAEALELAARYPDFLYPGLCIHPAFMETSRKWLGEFRRQGYLWVGELKSKPVAYSLLDEAFLDLCRECAEHNHIIQLHSNPEIVELARRMPDLRIVCSHLNRANYEGLKGLPNTWLDISGSAGGLHIRAREDALEIMGPDRLLHGTDFTGYEPRAFQARVEVAIPNRDDREKIYWKNLVDLLKDAGSKPIAP